MKKEFKGLTKECEKKLVGDIQLINSNDKIEGVEYINGEKYILLKNEK